MAEKAAAQSREDILRSRHKWYLGGGRALLWAPQFPQHLTAPGFWDPAAYLHAPVPRLFTVSVLEGGRALELRGERGDWVPSHLTLVHARQGLKITEARALLPDDTLASRLSIENTATAARTLDVVQWGMLDASAACRIDDTACTDGRIHLTCRHLTSGGKPDLEYRITYALAPATDSHEVAISEPGGAEPSWVMTPFYETFAQKLSDEIIVGGGAGGQDAQEAKCVFVGLHRRLRVPARKSVVVTALCNVGPVGGDTPAMDAVLSGADPVELSQRNWEAFFASVPDFRCSDPFIEKYYWYRWYGLRLNMVDHRGDSLPYPCVFEGTQAGQSRHALASSAWCHTLETRWMHDPSVARGSLLNFIAHQRSNGALPARINTGLATPSASGTCHANWGEAATALDELHRDDAGLEELHDSLARYANFLARERDAANEDLYDIASQAEMGQEHSPRYPAADEKADEGGSFQLKGVDATVYARQLLVALTWMARRLGRPADASRWQHKADRAAQAILHKMWNRKLRLFCDVHAKTREHSPVKCSTSFYPFLTDIPTKAHLCSLDVHLFHKGRFWPPFPVPSTSLDEELASASGLWKGERMQRPWNGRTWLLTNSHIAEALARTAIRFRDAKLRRRTVEFLRKFIRMLFLEGDIDRPTSCEYYNPLTGQPPHFRGVDDHMHSWIVDLIIKYVAGVRPSEGRLCVDPFDFQLKQFSVTNLRIQGRDVEVRYRRGTGIQVLVGGHLLARTRKLEPVYLALS